VQNLVKGALLSARLLLAAVSQEDVDYVSFRFLTIGLRLCGVALLQVLQLAKHELDVGNVFEIDTFHEDFYLAKHLVFEGVLVGPGEVSRLSGDETPIQIIGHKQLDLYSL
jgi:hypothetical protein